jgi:hypothetical protein
VAQAVECPVQQARSPEFQPQYHQKRKIKWISIFFKNQMELKQTNKTIK